MHRSRASTGSTAVGTWRTAVQRVKRCNGISMSAKVLCASFEARGRQGFSKTAARVTLSHAVNRSMRSVRSGNQIPASISSRGHAGPSEPPMYPLENFARDLYRAMRQLIRSREFALMAILTLAFGISANSAIFSIVKAVLLRPLPYRHPERLSWQRDVAHRDLGAYFNTYREFDAWRQQNRSFEKLAALTWSTGPTTLLWQGKPIDVLTFSASVDFFGSRSTGLRTIRCQWHRIASRWF